MRKFIFPILLAAVVAAPARADLTLEYQDGQGAQIFSMFVKGQRVRMESSGGHATVTLFDAGNRELTVLEPGDRSYMVIDPATIQEMRRQMEQALDMLRRQGIDPSTMGLDDFMPKVEARVVRTGESRTIDGRSCEVVRYEISDGFNSMACVVEPGTLGISDAEWAAISGIYEALADMTSQMLPSGGAAIELQSAAGIPLEAWDADGDYVQRLARVERAALDDSMFEVPAGWRRMHLGR